MPQNLKNYFWALLNLLLAVIIINILFFVMPAVKKIGNSFAPARTIVISGEGEITAIPDIATLSFSVVSEGVNPQKISEENAEKMNKALEFIKSQGVDEKDIKTSGYNLYPRYEYDEKKRTTFISGYTLTQTIIIKIRDFGKISEIIGTLPQKGINQISSLNFDVDDREGYLNKAREEAFEKAYLKAQQMASQNNTKIKRVVTFSESSGYAPVFRTFLGAVEKAAVMPDIEPGSQDITVTVSVTYELK